MTAPTVRLYSGEPVSRPSWPFIERHRIEVRFNSVSRIVKVMLRLTGSVIQCISFPGNEVAGILGGMITVRGPLPSEAPRWLGAEGLPSSG